MTGEKLEPERARELLIQPASGLGDAPDRFDTHDDLVAGTVVVYDLSGVRE